MENPEQEQLASSYGEKPVHITWDLLNTDNDEWLENQTDPVIHELVTIEDREKILLKWLNNIQIASVEEQKNCEDMLIHARQVLKEADAKRKELHEPYKREIDRINDLFKPFMDKLSMGINSVMKALDSWRLEQRRIAEAAQMEAMKKQAEAVAMSKVTGEIVEPITEVIPTVSKTSHANIGSVTYRKQIEVQVVNPDLVPRDLCEPSLSKIRKRAESGVREIPGVLITEKEIPVTRAR